MNTTGKKTPGSGRQKGTPNKATAEIRALAQMNAPAAIEELVRLSTEAENETTRVAAIRELLDRGYGKAQAGIDLNVASGEPTLVEILTDLGKYEADLERDEAAGTEGDRL